VKRDASWDIDDGGAGGGFVDVAKPRPGGHRGGMPRSARDAWETSKAMLAAAVEAGTHGTAVCAWCNVGRHFCDGIYFEQTGGGGGVAGTARFCRECWLATMSPEQRAAKLESWRLNALAAARIAREITSAGEGKGGR
jgi:hypothetical protein